MKKNSIESGYVATFSGLGRVNDLDVAEKIVRVDKVEHMNVYLGVTPDQLQAIVVNALEAQQVASKSAKRIIVLDSILKTKPSLLESARSRISESERYGSENTTTTKSDDEVLNEVVDALKFVGLVTSPVLFSGIVGILSFLGKRLKP